jgi:LysR family transcriptional regulator, mexEF-oprN operon transcriptional activator
MNEINLRNVDLNLLKAFDALDRERNVTAAAARLGIGQPAMSHALQRLRKIIDDPLFVRGPGGMDPTSRALELIGSIRQALAQIEEALRGGPVFEPLTTSQRFRIGMTDRLAAAIVPGLIQSLQSSAPRADLAIRNADRTNAASMLDDNVVDLVIGLFPLVPDWHQKADLFQEDFVCVYSAKLIKSKKQITMKQYLEHPHILTTLQGDETGFVDYALRKENLKRRILITSPFFLLSGYLLQQMPLIATLPRHYGELCVKTSGLMLSALPFATPNLKISMVWHRRNATTPISQFIRRLVVETISQKPS